jgi:hypothetical protein
VFILITSLAVVAVYAVYAGVHRYPGWWLNIVLTIALFGLHMLELQLLSPGNLFRFLDEAYFARESQAPLSDLLSQGATRYNAYLVYAHLAQVMTPEWILKAVNIPWLWVFMIQLFRISGSSPWVFRLFPLALPYLYILAFLNMRDMLGLVAVMMVINLLGTRVRYLEHVAVRAIAIILGLVLLASLRPQWVAFLAASMLVVPMLNGGTKSRIASVVATAAVLVVGLPLVSPWLIRLQAVAAFSVEARGSERVDLIARGAGFGVASGVIGVGRQLFTPLPSSKLVALLREPPGSNLYLKEVTRMVMNTWFVGSVIYVLLHLGGFAGYIRRNKAVALLAVFAGINTIVYGMYFFGVGSSRNKVLPMILVFLYVCYALEQRSPVRSRARDQGTSLQPQPTS